MAMLRCFDSDPHADLDLDLPSRASIGDSHVIGVEHAIEELIIYLSS